MRNVLITGSAGFVGSHFARELERRGDHVYRCDPRHAPIRGRGDCRHLDAIPGTPPRFDLVLHCAAMVEGREAIDGKPALLGAYNLQLDGAIFEWALKAKPRRLVYFSSSAAYPVSLQHAAAQRLHEADCNPEHGPPDATYGWVKLTGERIATEVRNAGVPVTVVRPFSGYGQQQDDCYPFPAMIQRAARRDDPFIVWGDGQQVRDFIHIQDIVDAVLTLVDCKVDGPVNLGTGIPTSMDELARMVQQAARYSAPLEHLADKPSGVSRRVADISLLSQHYTPRISLKRDLPRALFAARLQARAA